MENTKNERIRIHYKIRVNGKFLTFNKKLNIFEYVDDEFDAASWAVVGVFVRFVRLSIKQFGLKNIEIVTSYYGKHIKGSVRSSTPKHGVLESFTVEKFFKRNGFEYVNFENISFLSKAEKELFECIFTKKSIDTVMKYFQLSKKELDSALYCIRYKLRFGKPCDCILKINPSVN